MLFLFVRVCACAWPCARCARVLFFFVLSTALCWTSTVVAAAAETHTLKHSAPAGQLCVCVRVHSSSVLPKQEHPKLFPSRFPARRGYTLSQVAAAQLNLTLERSCEPVSVGPSKHGRAAESIEMMAVIFRPCILSLCSGRPTNEVTHQLIDVCVSKWASVFVMPSSRHRNRFPLSLRSPCL